MADSKLTIKVDGDTKNFQKSLSDVTQGTKELQDKLSSIAMKATAAFAGLSATIGGLISTYRTQEQAEKKLATVLKSTGHAAGLTADELKKMASGFQNVSTFGDEAIIDAQSLLLTFTKIGKDVFPMATETILDMSAAMGTDLKSSTVMLGKALNDPVAGIAALGRVGVQLTDEQKNLIKSFSDLGDTASAQKVILEELEVQFGGQARATAEGTGRFIQLSNTLGDMAEVIGKKLTKPLSEMAQWLNDIFVNILGKHGDELGEIAATTLLFATNVAVLTAGLALAAKGMVLFRAAAIATGITLKGLKGAMIGTGIGALIVALAYALTKFMENFKANMEAVQKMWKTTIQMFADVWAMVLGDMRESFSGFIGWFAKGFGTLGKGFDKFTSFVSRKFIAGFSFIATQIKEVFTGMGEFIDDKTGGILTRLEEKMVAYNEKMDSINDERKEKIKAQMEADDAAEDKRDKKKKKKKKKSIIDQEAFILAAGRRETLSLIRSDELRTKREKLEGLKRSENLKSTLGTISSLTSSNNQTLFDVGRAAALSMAYIDGHAAVLKALKSAPPPFNFVLAATVGAAVAVQIGQILSAKPPKMADGGIITGGMRGLDSVPAMLMPGELVVPTRNFEETINAVGGARGQEIFGDENQIGLVIGFDSDEAGQFLTAQQIENQALGISIQEAS